MWDSNHGKVKRSILSQNNKNLSLNFVTGIDKYIEALNINWVKRLKSPDNTNWKINPRFYFDRYGKKLLVI